jgi:hypothetical protein
MAKRKPYNPHTQYGRKKLREEAEINYNKMTPSDKGSHDFVLFIISLIIIVLGVSMCGTKWINGGGGYGRRASKKKAALLPHLSNTLNTSGFYYSNIHCL